MIQIISAYFLLKKIDVINPNIVNKISLTTMAICNIEDFYLTIVNIEYIMTSRVQINLDLVQHLSLLCHAIDMLYHTLCNFRYEITFLSLEESLHETDLKSTGFEEKTYYILY